MRGDFSVFRSRLLAWFRREKRTLPWRTEPSLYKTVVSEFMLQQTQVDTVLPYFANWLQLFPGFEQLAAASEASVLKQWEGLGYYSRARNLHKLARSICSDGVPVSVGEWQQRPGVGPYTAAAIASIAQGVPEPVIDGNVIRVLARLTADHEPIRSAADGRKRLLPIARKLLDPGDPGDFNEGIMELGATVCRKSRPACGQCPVNTHCLAHERGAQDAIPVIIRKATTRREIARLWLIKENRLLLHFYPTAAKRLAGLAELPQICADSTMQPLLTRSRGISSEQVRESIFALDTDHPQARDCLQSSDCRWVSLEMLSDVSLSAPHRRWIYSLLERSRD